MSIKIKEIATARLTLREQEILHELLDGYTNREVAGRLEISQRTVEIHRAHIMKKIDAKTGMDLAVKVLA